MYQNLHAVQQSYSVAFADYVREREREGQVIVKMQTGDPDFAAHPIVVEAACSAIRSGELKYCDSKGLPTLRQAIQRKLLKKNKMDVSWEKNVIVTHGAVHGINMAVRALINPGDECIILEPFWRAYQMDVVLAGGTPVFIRTKAEAGFQLDADEVIARFGPKTRLLIINSPNNPSGAVYKKAELIKLAATAAERGVYIISDEVYEEIIFGEREHFSVGSYPETFDNVVSVFSMSKTYAMTGWRLGYLVASQRIVDEILKLSQFSATCISPAMQVAASVALSDPAVAEYVVKMRDEYTQRRALISRLIRYSWLNKALHLPEGTFYSLVDVSRFDLPSLELSKMILEKTGFAYTPGVAFGDDMDSFIRICFATSQENVGRSIESLAEFGCMR